MASIQIDLLQPPQAEAAVLVTNDYKLYAAKVADQEGIDKEQFLTTLEKEGMWRNGQSMIPSKTGPNGREDSWGCAQIHLPDHPTITKGQAQDCMWSIQWAAEQFRLGRQSMWTVWRNIYGNDSS